MKSRRPIRVGLFTYGMSAELTGIGRYARSLSQAMAAHPGAPEVILLNPYPRSALDWYRQFTTYDLPPLQRLPVVMTLGSSILTWVARRLRLDILHDPCGIAPFLAPALGVRRVVTIHDAIPYVLPDTQPLLTRAVFRTLIPAARWTADAVLTTSRHAAADLRAHVGFDPKQVRVVYPGVEAPDAACLRSLRERARILTRTMGGDGAYFLSVGGQNRRKNLDRLVTAFELVRVRHPNIRLILTGPGEGLTAQTTTEDGLSKAVNRLRWRRKMIEQLPQGVLKTGHVDDETLSILYAGALGVVFPSLYEGFGFPALEGMAHGAPVITSNVSSLPEVAGNACLLVDPLRPQEISSAMLRLVEDGSLRAMLSDRGHKRAAGFTWKRTAEETLAVYEELVAKPSGACSARP